MKYNPVPLRPSKVLLCMDKQRYTALVADLEYVAETLERVHLDTGVVYALARRLRNRLKFLNGEATDYVHEAQPAGNGQAGGEG